jgi:hypothetical protein
MVFEEPLCKKVAKFLPLYFVNFVILRKTTLREKVF